MTGMNWRSFAAVLLMVVIAVSCGGSHGGEELVPPEGNENDNSSPVTGGTGSAAVIEFVTPGEGDGGDDQSDDAGGIGFESNIGPAGTSNPQASRVRFRVLNAAGRPAKEGIKVAFALEGPTDATLSTDLARTANGIVEVLVRAGEISGPAVVVATVVDKPGLVARSAVITIGRVAGPATAIEFFGLRTPELLGGEDQEPGAPESRTQLGLRGSGFAQSVDVVFAVLDQQGGAAADGTIVTFTLFGPNGGESIVPALTTSSEGFVSATISTGTRPGPVEVEARVQGTTIIARAIPITIGSGLNPTGSHLSMAAECLNMAGSVFFGIEDEIRVGVSDQFNNPIPIGSAVSFLTEGGVIGAQGVSQDGFRATAKLVSQAPLPPDHRATVIAITTGEESFTDLNGNARFDVGEPFVDLPPEVFLDANEDGVYQLGEVFIDQNNNGVYDGTSNGIWDDQILISSEIPIVFSGHTQISIDPTTFDLAPGAVQTFTVDVSDEVGAALVGGTTITFTATNATVFPASITLPDTDADTSHGPLEGLTRFTIQLRNDQPVPSPAPSGGTPVPTERPASLTVTVKSPAVNGSKCPAGNGDASVTVLGNVQ